MTALLIVSVALNAVMILALAAAVVVIYGLSGTIMKLRSAVILRAELPVKGQRGAVWACRN